MTDLININPPSGELPAEPSKDFPWRGIVEGFAWVALVAAFIIGQIAAKPDYESMLKEALPGEVLVQSEVNTALPVVYRLKARKTLSSWPKAKAMAAPWSWG